MGEKMKVDSSKVNLIEKDIEDYLWGNPSEVATMRWYVSRWVKRQFRLPSGILDLWGVTDVGEWVVVEVKNVEVNASAVAQVCRYADDLESIIAYADARRESWVGNCCIKVIVGPAISAQTLRECEACGVLYMEFGVQYNLEIAPVSFTKEYLASRNEQYLQLSDDSDLSDALDWLGHIKDERAKARDAGDSDNVEDEKDCPF